jgi:hypothetical protein
MNEKMDLRDRTKKFALRVAKLFRSLPKTIEPHLLANQILRSGLLSAPIIAKPIADETRPDSLRTVASACTNPKRSVSGSSYLDSRIVRAVRLADFCAKWDEVTAIFVAILKRARSPC